MTKEAEKLMKELIEKIDKISTEKTAEFKYSTSIKEERKISRVDYENDTMSIMVTVKSDDLESSPEWDVLEMDLREFVDKWETDMRSRTRHGRSSATRKKFGGYKGKKE